MLIVFFVHFTVAGTLSATSTAIGFYKHLTSISGESGRELAYHSHHLCLSSWIQPGRDQIHPPVRTEGQDHQECSVCQCGVLGRRVEAKA